MKRIKIMEKLKLSAKEEVEFLKEVIQRQLATIEQLNDDLHETKIELFQVKCNEKAYREKLLKLDEILTKTGRQRAERFSDVKLKAVE